MVDTPGEGDGLTYRSVEATQARQSFREIVDEVFAAGRRILIRRHGRPIAALVSVRDLEMLRKRDLETDAKLLSMPLDLDSFVPLSSNVEDDSPASVTLHDFISQIWEDFDAALVQQERPISVYFVLNELNDMQEPYFGLVSHILSNGCSITYSSDKEEVLKRVPQLRRKLATSQVVDSDIASRSVKVVPIRPRVAADNLCFIVTSEGSVLYAYTAWRRQRQTVGGTRLLEDEAQEEWNIVRDAEAQWESDHAQSA